MVDCNRQDDRIYGIVAFDHVNNIVKEKKDLGRRIKRPLLVDVRPLSLNITRLIPTAVRIPRRPTNSWLLKL